MTTAEAMSIIGNTYAVKVDQWTVDMTAIDVKSSYGQDRVLVHPAGMSDREYAWISIDRLMR